MENRIEIYNNYLNSGHDNAVSINDLRDKEYQNLRLSEEEAQALLNFDRYRLNELNKTSNDADFNARYCQLQILANIADYTEFLKEEYFFSELL